MQLLGQRKLRFGDYFYDVAQFPCQLLQCHMLRSLQEPLTWTLQPFSSLPKCHLLSKVLPEQPFENCKLTLPSQQPYTLPRHLSPSDKLL